MPTSRIETVRHLKGAGILEDIAVGAFPFTFKEANLVYGFNGSGKTTLSRLIDSISDSGVSANLPEEVDFSFALNDGSTPSRVSPSSSAKRFIAVFNEDYVEKTLTWKEGTARPIIYLGEEQAEAAKKLRDLEAQATKAGPEEVLRNSEWSSASRALEVKCRDIARLVAEEANLGRRYNASNLKTDYASKAYSPSDIIDDTERKRLKEVINRSDLPSPIPRAQAIGGGEAASATVQEALNESVGRITIAALERRKDALDWIEEGIHLHNKEQECLFCGETLLGRRMHDLEEAISGGFSSFSGKIDAAISTAKAFGTSCRSSIEELTSTFEALPTYSGNLAVSRSSLLAYLRAAIDKIETWIELLAHKRSNPDAKLVMIDERLDNWDARIGAAFGHFNSLVVENNQALANFSVEQSLARDRVMGHHLAEHHGSYQDAVALEASTRLEQQKASEEVRRIEADIAKIQAELKSHGPASKELNKLLKSYLGHDQYL